MPAEAKKLTATPKAVSPAKQTLSQNKVFVFRPRCTV
jgi:hypothetical protein